MAHKVIEGGIFHVKSSDLDFGMAQNVDHVLYFRDGSLFQAKICDGSQFEKTLSPRIFLTEKVSHL